MKGKKRNLVWRSANTTTGAGIPRELNPLFSPEGYLRVNKESREVRRLKARQLSKLNKKNK
jgi:hypothetical protein